MTPPNRTPYIRLSTTYFFYFAALGALFPYWGPYLEHLGFAPREIGELMATLMAARIAAPPLLGWLADRWNKAAGLVRVTSWITAVAFAGVFVDSSYGWLLLVMTAFSFTWAGTLAPFEALTLRFLGEHTRRYGLVRIGGSLGFIVAVTLLGALLEERDVTVVPVVCQGVFLATAIVTLALPRAALPPRVEQQRRLGDILRRPAVLGLLGLTLLMQASHGPYYTFFSIHLDDLGYSSNAIGWFWALGVVAEMGIFLVMAPLLARFRARTLMVASLALTSLRWVLIGTLAHLPLVLGLAQTLHAASYAIFHSLVIAYLHRFFTGGTEARGQALYASLSYGLGGALGSLASGYAWTSLGPAGTYMAAAALPILGLAVTARWLRD